MTRITKMKEPKIGDWIVTLICFLVILLCVLPMINLLAQSFSSSDAVIHGKVTFVPVIHSIIELPSQDDGQSFWDQNVFQGEEESVNDFFDFSDFDYGDDYDYDSYFYGDWHDFSFDYGFDDFDYYGDWDLDGFDTPDPEGIVFRYGMTLESYRYVFLDPSFTRSMWWTAILTIICTIVSLVMTILCAYPLTYSWLRGKTLINTLIIFTMYFSAGTIPNYILMRSLGLLNNPLVLIIPNCLSVFNMIILRSFFFGIPDSLRESAEIDGANPVTVLLRIYLPLSTSVLATLALFYAVGRWNGFTDALLYLSTAPEWEPIQLKLWKLIQNMTSIDVTTVEMVSGSVPRASDAIKAAAIMFATVPILLVYPWLQRYFITGVTIGAVKG